MSLAARRAAGQLTLLELCKDQLGCRMLQSKLHEKRDCGKHLELVLQGGVLENICELMVHSFGNYLCQRIFEIIQYLLLSRGLKF